MDFLDPKKKKASLRRLYIGYVLVAIAILFGALVLLYAALGYGVDRKGNVFQNGLVFFASTPDAAEVTIQSTTKDFNQKITTSDRQVLAADEYKFEFLKEGYRPWNRTLTLRGGSVERLIYPFLFPNTLETASVQKLENTPGLVSASPDRQKLLVQRPGSMTRFDMYDTDASQQPPESFVLPSSILPDNVKIQDMKLVEWSTNNRHVLVRIKHNKSFVFLLIDTDNPTQSLSVNSLFNQVPKAVRLRDKSPEKFYILLKDNRLATGTVSEPELSLISSSVATFQPHGDDTIVFVTTSNIEKTKKAEVRMLTNEQTYTIRELPADSTYHLDIARFNDSWFVVAGSKKDDEVYVYRNPVQAIERREASPEFTTRTLRINGTDKVAFSANSRFIAAQNDDRFVVYDAEQDRQYRYDTPVEFDNNVPAEWMDGHRLVGISDAAIVVFDFDGINVQTLSPGLSGFGPFFDADYEFLFSIAKNSKKEYSLTRTNLRVETQQ